MGAVHLRAMMAIPQGYASRTTLADVQLFLWDTYSYVRNLLAVKSLT